MTPKTNRNPKKKITYIARAALPADGYVRLPTAIAFFGVSKNTYLNSDIFPQGFLLTPRTRVIPVEDIRAADEKIRKEREKTPT